jgi:hypothetical protein
MKGFEHQEDSGYGMPIKIKLGSTVKGGFDGLAQVRWAHDSSPATLTGYSSDEQEVLTHVAPNHSTRRHRVTSTGYLLMPLYCYTNTTVHALSVKLARSKFVLITLSRDCLYLIT